MAGAAFRGECPTCGGDYAITAKGLVGKHPASRAMYDDGKGKCTGGGKPFKIEPKK